MISSKYLKLNYIVLFLVIIWDPLRAYVFDFSGVGFIYLAITSIGILYELRKKNFIIDLFKAPYIYWVLWCGFAIINTFLIHSYHFDSAYNFIYVTILPVFLMLIIAREEYSIPVLNNVVIVAFTVRILFSLFFDSFARLGSDEVSRLGENFNANAIAFGGFFLLCCLGLKKIYKAKLKLYEWILIFIGLYIVFITSSRKTIIAILILLIGYIYIFRSTNVIKRYFGLFLASISLLIISFVIINKTSIGYRIQESYDKTLDARSSENMFDNRAGQYIQGYNQLVDNPITGVGLYNFGYVGPIKISAHSEYIVQLAENGIVGFLLFLGFYITIFKRLSKTRSISKLDRKISEFFIFFLISVSFLMTGAWVYNLSIYWVVLGLAIKYSNDRLKYIEIR